ncbi:MAG: TetR/AcrR family transcriptional regulator [Candidimonas sp.]
MRATVDNQPSNAQLKDKIHHFRQEEIIKTAGELFYEQGYTNTSMTQIASSLGIGKPLIYSYFNGKADLLGAVCNRVPLLVANLTTYALQTTDSPTRKLQNIIRELCLNVIKDQHCLAVLLREEKHLSGSARKELAKNEQFFRNVISRLLEEGREAGEFVFDIDVRVLSHALAGMTTWIYSWYRENGPMAPDEIAKHMAKIALASVGAKAEAG